MRPLIAILLLTASLAAGEAWAPRPGVLVQPDGRMQAGGLVLLPVHFDDQWRQTTSERVEAAGAKAGASWRLEGPWRTAAGVAKYVQTVAASGADAVAVTAKIDHAGPTSAFALSLNLEGAQYRRSTLRIDGKPLELAGESPQPVLRPGAPAKLVAIPVPGGWLELSGNLSVMVQDNLSWKSDSFSLRVLGDAKQQVALNLRLRQSVIAALPLGAAAVTARRDDDGSGWIGQAGKDLRLLPTGTLSVARIPFAIADGAAVLSTGKLAGRPAQATVPATGRHGACLYLLHALADAPAGEVAVGSIRVVAQDGSSEVREVRSARDAADWRNPAERLPNGVLAWTGDTAQERIGLHVSRFPIGDKPLDRVELSAAEGAVWMVVGLALGEDAPLPIQIPDTIAESPRWRPIEPGWETEPGSALDLSALNAGPVPGRLIASGAHLALASRPEVPVRLLGANLCFTANFPDHPLAERMARAMRALGYNAVRFHHYDGGLVKPGGDGTEPDPDQLDRLDYLMARCKAEGLWTTTDVYVSRRIPKGIIPELPDRELGQEFKALVPLLPSAMDNWKKFATAFLGHKNPYTGLTWAEDPALATLSMVNEDNLTHTAEADPRIRALYDARFAAWLATRPEAEFTGKPREEARRRWLRDLQAAAFVVMRDHVRSLGVRAPTTTCNFISDWWSLSVRDAFDLVDNHAYHDHPHFPAQQWRLPFAFTQRNPVADLLGVPAGLAWSRRLDRPFTITELNYVLPNAHRAQYAVGVAAVAGLQDWDGVWRFAMAHDIKRFGEPGPASGFDLVCDPISFLGERGMALLWRRGDVTSAPWAAAVVYDPTVAVGNGGPPGLTTLALHARVGNLPAAGAQTTAAPGLKCLLESPQGGKAAAGALPVLPCDNDLLASLAKAGLMPAGDLDLTARTVRSAGGQIAIDAKVGILSVTTPRSVAAVLPGGASAALGGIVIANPDRDEATVIVAALDGDLATGKRLLVLHLTDALNSGMRFGDRGHTLVEDWGAAPVLVRAGVISVRLPGAVAGKAWALDLRGIRREEAPLVADGDAVRLDASVARTWGACLAWEIARD